MAAVDYPVPRLAKEVVSAWSEELAAHFGVTAQDIKDQSTRLISFPLESVRIELMDGSKAEFKYAFALFNESQRAIAVFTEHCGHHIFPAHDAKVFRDDVLIYEFSSLGVLKSSKS